MRRQGTVLIVGLVVAVLIIPCSSLCPAEDGAAGTWRNVPSPTADGYGGYTLFSPIFSKTVYLIDHDGKVVHTWETAYQPGEAAYLLNDGSLIRSANPGPDFNPTFKNGGGKGGIVQRIAWNGTVEWEFTYSNATHDLHHDIEVMPNGHVLMIAWELRTGTEAIAAGRNPALLVDGELWPDHVIEVEPDGPTSGKIVWEWHVWDHLVQRYNSSLPNYGLVKDHPELIDLNFVTYPRAFADWNHINSIEYNPDLDQILLSCHQFNEIWIIDHSTNTTEAAGHRGGRFGRGGDLLYRWGNPIAYRAGVQADEKLFRQHDARWIGPGLNGTGHILLFNNGPNRPGGPYSTVDEIVTPMLPNDSYDLVPGGAYGPAGPVWSYVAPNPGDFYSSIISSAQRLLDGNTLICEGDNGVFFEVTPGKERVWNFTNPYPAGGPAEVFAAMRYYPPYIGAVGTMLPTEDVPFTFNLSAIIQDPDTPMDKLVLSQNSSYARLVGLELRMTYPNGVLRDIINLTVKDPMFTVHKEIFVNVTPVNDPPSMTVVPLRNATEDSEYSFDMNATDIDSPQSGLSWKMTTKADWLAIEANGTLNGVPDNGDIGKFDVEIGVTDPGGGNDSVLLQITIVNTPPVITTANVIDATQGQPYSVDYGSDDEGQGEAAWLLISGASWLGINATSGALIGTPENKDVGDHLVNVSIDDGNGGTASTEFMLRVGNANDPPSITTVDVLVAYEDRPYSVHYAASDPDPSDTNFTWTITTSAAFLNISRETGWLNGTPGNDDVGTYYVNLIVRDPGGATDAEYFHLEVMNVNDPPVITSSPNTSVWGGSCFNYKMNATDVDKGDTLQYLLVSGPEGAKVNGSKGELSWCPTSDQLGDRTFVVGVKDSNMTVEQRFIVKAMPRLDVSIKEPTNGKKISGKATVKGTASGSKAVRLEISFDGTTWKNITGDPGNWSYTFDSTTMKNGQYVIRVRARAEYDLTFEDKVTVKVDNQAGIGRASVAGSLIAVVVILVVVLAVLAFVFRERKVPRKGHKALRK